MVGCNEIQDVVENQVEMQETVPQGKVVRYEGIYCNLQNEYRGGVEEEKENKGEGKEWTTL